MTALVLVATIAGEKIAIDAADVEAVVDLWQIVRVPLAPDHIIGVAAVRSRVLTVVDAAAAVGLRAKATGNRAIVIDTSGHRYALRVDSVAEVVSPIGDIKNFDGPVGDHWRGISKGTVDTPHGFSVLVDPVRLVSGQLHEAA
jgi:purine-binding chemotaxis protein CheW